MTDTEPRPPALSVEETIGQMLFPALRGSLQLGAALDQLQYWVEDLGVGGFIVFDAEVFEFPGDSGTLQRWAKTPLLFASDLERGVGQQLRGAPGLPDAETIGRTRSAELAREAGRITGAHAGAFGIRLALAPVVDVLTEKESAVLRRRTFGGETELVAELGAAWIEGCQSAGVAACAKHFPGHGATPEDSHTVQPTVTLEREALEQTHLMAFRRALESNVHTIMTAHVRYTALDPDRPASLSPAVTGTLLREDLGFEGVVLTDALIMKGIGEGVGEAEAAVQAVEAGADLLLYPEDVGACAAALRQAVSEGRLGAERLRRSAERIVSLKRRLGVLSSPGLRLENLELPRMREQAERLAKNIQSMVDG